MDLAVLAIIIIGVAFVVMVLDIMPLGVTIGLTCIVMQLTGILDITRVYSDFGSTTVIFLVAMLIIGNGIFEVGLAQDLGNILFKTRLVKNERLMIFVLTIIAGLISGVVSNSATIAMFIPLIQSVHAESNGRIRQKNILMSLGMACAVGGTLTLSGSPPQVIAQGLLEEAGVRTMTYAEMGKVALPLLIIVAIYMSTIGYKLLRKLNINDDVDPEVIAAGKVEAPKWKKWAVGIVVGLCLIGFFTSTWNIAYVSVFGATVLMAIKAIDWKKSFKAVDWNAVMVLGFSTAMAAGMNSSGAGQLLADKVLALCGGETASAVVVTSAMTIFALIITNVMANSATVAMLTPIAISLSLALGVEPITMVAPIAIAGSCAIATPIGTPCMTQVLPAGYRFKDYLIVGIPVTVLLAIGLVVLSPIMFH